MISYYAKSIGVTESDAHTARNIHLSVADCKHLKIMLLQLNKAIDHTDIGDDINKAVILWNEQLIDYFKGAV